MDLSISRRLRRTPFSDRVFAQGATAFTIYNHMLLPAVFRSLQEDRDHLCHAVQVWDVSAERQVEITGPDADRLVQWMTPRDIGNVVPGRCVYLPLVDEFGKLVNDPVGLRLDTHRWWLSIADSDVLLWARGLARGAGLDVNVFEPDVWPLAVQGPRAEELVSRVFGDAIRDIRFFRFAALDYRGHPFNVARSGWSKQGGFEIYVDDAVLGQALFDELMEQGADLDVRAGCPNGIERVESSLLSYGNDMDANDSPLETGLGGFIDLDADIDALSLAALRAERDEPTGRRLAGLVVESDTEIAPLQIRGIIGSPSSEIRSQAWSAFGGARLGIVMLEADVDDVASLTVTLASGERVEAQVCTLPFNLASIRRPSDPSDPSS